MKRCSDFAELDLFSECDECSLFEKVLWDEFACDDILSNDLSQLNFTLRAGGKRSMVDLSRAQLFVKLQIVKPDGTTLADVGGKKASELVAPANNALHTMFEDCVVFLNGVEAFNANGHYNYNSYILDLLDTTDEQKESFMTAQGWYKDTAGKFTENNEKNDGWKKRAALFGANEHGLIGTLHSELFNQQRYLVDGVEVKVQLTLAKPAFFLQSVIKEAKIKINKLYELGPADGAHWTLNGSKQPLS